MKFFISELQYLSELYQRFKTDILASFNTNESRDASFVAERILKNRDLLGRIEQMTGRTAQLVQEWEKLRLILDARSRSEIQALAMSVKSQAAQLEQLCKGLARQLETSRSDLERELMQLQKGTRYLHTVRPQSTNYPKFIDSVG